MLLESILSQRLLMQTLECQRTHLGVVSVGVLGKGNEKGLLGCYQSLRPRTILRQMPTHERGISLSNRTAENATDEKREKDIRESE